MNASANLTSFAHGSDCYEPTGRIYQVAMTKDFKPYRVDVKFFDAKETSIKPLIGALSFIKN